MICEKKLYISDILYIFDIHEIRCELYYELLLFNLIIIIINL